jgi:signal recognition particle subunit SRP54
MVLAELGGKLKKALSDFVNQSYIDESAIKDLLKEISYALLLADVNAELIKKLKDNILKATDFEKLPGLDKRKYVKKVVFEELTKLITQTNEAPKLQKGKPNIVMVIFF